MVNWPRWSWKEELRNHDWPDAQGKGGSHHLNILNKWENDTNTMRINTLVATQKSVSIVFCRCPIHCRGPLRCAAFISTVTSHLIPPFHWCKLRKKRSFKRYPKCNLVIHWSVTNHRKIQWLKTNHLFCSRISIWTGLGRNSLTLLHVASSRVTQPGLDDLLSRCLCLWAGAACQLEAQPGLSIKSHMSFSFMWISPQDSLSFLTVWELDSQMACSKSPDGGSKVSYDLAWEFSECHFHHIPMDTQITEVSSDSREGEVTPPLNRRKEFAAIFSVLQQVSASN